MGEVFDLDALAVEAEEEEPFRFRWNEREFSIPTIAQMDWHDSIAYFNDPDLTPHAKMQLLLGAQYDAFCSKPMTAARLGALLDQWIGSQGTSEGESGASPSS